jgi:hypothetical protein
MYRCAELGYRSPERANQPSDLRPPAIPTRRFRLPPSGGTIFRIPQYVLYESQSLTALPEQIRSEQSHCTRFPLFEFTSRVSLALLNLRLQLTNRRLSYLPDHHRPPRPQFGNVRRYRKCCESAIAARLSRSFLLLVLRDAGADEAQKAKKGVIHR